MVRSQLRTNAAEVTPAGRDFSTFRRAPARSYLPGRDRLCLREPGFRALAFARVPGYAPLGMSGSRQPRRLAAALRPRPRLAMGLRQPRLANALLGSRPFSIPG